MRGQPAHRVAGEAQLEARPAPTSDPVPALEPAAGPAPARGKNYETDAIGGIGSHNTWINDAGTRVYLEVLTGPGFMSPIPRLTN